MTGAVTGRQVYYEALAQKLAAECTCIGYMADVEAKLVEEIERVRTSLALPSCLHLPPPEENPPRNLPRDPAGGALPARLDEGEDPGGAVSSSRVATPPASAAVPTAGR